MAEKNGKTVEIGDRILVNGTQLASVTRYDVDADRMAWVFLDGRGTNTQEAHISNTTFELVNEEDLGPVFTEVAENLDAEAGKVSGVSNGAPEESTGAGLTRTRGAGTDRKTVGSTNGAGE